MERTLVAGASGQAQNPLRTVLAPGLGWFATMPAFVRAGPAPALGAKLVTAFPGNATCGIPTHQALVVLVDHETGVPLAVVAGKTITERRTAAVSVLATQRLAARPRGTLALLGAGAQARAHLEAFVDASLVTSARVWSRSAERAERLALYGRTLGTDSSVAAEPAAALAGADVIVTATSAAQPFFASQDIADGAHLNAVGACVADRRELPASLVAEAAIYVDSREAAARESGDIVLAMRELGDEGISIRAELGEMLADPTRCDPPARVTIFESLGLGIEDVACAAYVLPIVRTGGGNGQSRSANLVTAAWRLPDFFDAHR